MQYRRLAYSLGAWILTVAAPAVLAQQYSPHEVGIGIASETGSAYYDASNYSGAIHDFAGPLGRYTFNFSPSLAIEGSVAYLPGFQTGGATDNGHELLALGGVKAGWRGRRFGLYGKAEPGISSWSPGLVLLEGNPLNPRTVNQRRTDFTLDLGAVAEWYPTLRTIVRFDAGPTLIAEYDQVLNRVLFPGAEFLQILPGHIAQHFSAQLSIAHRFGVLRDEREREPARRPVEMGALFSLQQRVHEDGDAQILPNRGAGAWLSWNFSKYVALDSTAFYSPQNDRHAFPQDGGKDLVALWGIKAGLRRDRLGYFATVRPGMIQFSRTNQYQNFWASPPVILNGKTTDYVFDIGGILEYYASKHLLLRADIGNAVVHYHAANLRYVANPVSTTPADAYYPPFQRPSILTLFGAGWRF